MKLHLPFYKLGRCTQRLYKTLKHFTYIVQTQNFVAHINKHRRTLHATLLQIFK